MSKINLLGGMSDTERRILEMIRSMELFDSVEIKYSKQGELLWTLTRKHRGTYEIDLHANDDVV